MEYRPLGRTGTKVSRICLGTLSFGNSEEWMLGLEKARPIVEKALDLGVNFFDTADSYSAGKSEEIVGNLLKGCRDQVVIATKVYFKTEEGPNGQGLSRTRIMRQIEASLRRLQTDRVDLYQIHRWDYTTPIEETLETLGDLVREGKTTYTGASSMFAWQFAKSLFLADAMHLPRFVSMQDQYNLCYREEEREMIPLCRDQGIALIPWSPLARGFLSGGYARGKLSDRARLRSDELLKARFFRSEDFDVLEAVESVAKEKGVSPSQIALAWLFGKEAVTSPIIGVTTPEHVEEAVQAMDVKLSPDDIRRIEEPYRPRGITGFS
jgi:1-deoxyxylulose-5-phosphate synthase